MVINEEPQVGYLIQSNSSSDVSDEEFQTQRLRTRRRSISSDEEHKEGLRMMMGDLDRFVYNEQDQSLEHPPNSDMDSAEDGSDYEDEGIFNHRDMGRRTRSFETGYNFTGNSTLNQAHRFLM